jgi:integrase
MARQVRQRFTYVNIEQHRRKGKQGQDLTDPEVPGLYYQRQGDRVYARVKVMNKATKKRELHSWEGPLPTVPELMERVPSGPNAPTSSALAEGKKLQERIRAWARQKRMEAKGFAPHAAVGPAAAQRTVAELVEKYEATAYPKLRPNTVQQTRSYLRNFVLPTFGTRAVGSIKREEIEELHASLDATPYQANRVLSVLRTIFGKAVEWNWRPDNPAGGIKPFTEHGREDWYTEEELTKLVAALKQLAASDNKGSRVSARAILLALYTGARPTEVLSATWDMFDLEAGTWTKPSSHVKQKRIHHLALNADAVGLLRTLRDERTEGFVFPSPFVPGQHLKEVGRTWDRAVKEAGVRRLRLYDLRHSVGSVLANAGVDLYTVGKQLGHAQTKTTARYAHLAVETQRKAADTFSELLKRNGNGS